MMKYGPSWWLTRLYWNLHEFTEYLMSPCRPMRIAMWLDDRVFRRWMVLRFYDTWTLRLNIILGGLWRDMVYGKEKTP